ncbi:hypothetical protein BV898_01187 [Hypsibius exemplaris]|uniref:Gustatory receptor n=1 Tax=Hypsibius exemplaris TaxID=2072580 RepID=A0A1W0XC46_HYPEX|nr:hypothetical protein BV898_01187 [Hypsibius exemplaris]
MLPPLPNRQRRLNFTAVLEGTLKLVGFLTDMDTPRRTFRQHFLSCLLIAIALFNLIYELASATLNVIAHTNLVNYDIAEAVNLLQYPLKTFTTLTILLTFRRKSHKISAIMKDVSTPRLNCSIRSTRSFLVSNRVAALFLVTCVANLLGTACYRILRVAATRTDTGEWPLSAFPPWPKMNVMQEHVMTFLLRSSITEPIKLFCSGYLVLLLYTFKQGLCSDCSFLMKSSAKKKQHPVIIDMIRKGWDTRVEALRLTAAIQKEFGSLLTLILISDIMSLLSTFGDFLFLSNPITYLRNFSAILTYLVSFMGVASTLISLMEKDDETVEALKKLQSTVSSSTVAPETTDCELRQSRLNVLQNYATPTSPTERSIERTAKLEVIQLLSVLKSTCFGARKAAPFLPVFGYVTSGTVTNV